MEKKNEKNIEIEINNVKTYGWGVRHVQVMLLFTCFTVAYIIRTTMSVAIIAITDQSSPRDGIQTFDWPKQTQDFVQSSFYWGYTFMQIPAGHFASKYGGKRFIGCALIINSFLSFAMPTAAKIGGWKAFCACRSLQGLSQGCMLPSLHTLLGKWAPVTERNRLGNAVYVGGNVGTIIAMPMSGFLAASHYGWTSIFYIVGFISFCSGVIWLICGADSPAQHNSITVEERTYIQESLGQLSDLKKKKKVLKAPWRSFISSIPLGGLLIAHIGAGWGFYTMLTQTPSFIKMALGANIEQSGMLTSFSYTLGFVVMMLTSNAADFLVSRKIFSITVVRKLANTLGTWGPACGIVTLTLIPLEQTRLAIIIMIITIGLDSANCSGFLMNHIDLSPNFAGLLISVTNTIAAGLINLSPVVSGLIVQDPSDITQWHSMLLITAGVYFFSNSMFVILGSGEKQPWDTPNECSDDTENKSEEAAQELINKTAQEKT